MKPIEQKIEELMQKNAVRSHDMNLRRDIAEVALFVLDEIAHDQGWEESRNYYAQKLGLPEIDYRLIADK